MKKFWLSLIILCGFILNTQAGEFAKIQYNNLKENSKITYNSGTDSWSAKVNKKDGNYYIKTISDGSGSYSEFLNPDGDFAFSTGTQYEFIYNGNLIGYSNQDLKFYDFSLIDGQLITREMPVEEVQELFPEYEIVRISDFSPNTNSLKVKKRGRNFKLIILNDTDRNFYNYSYSSNNAQFKTYPLKGFLDISKKGMIQFSHFGDNSKSFPWFILLVR